MTKIKIFFKKGAKDMEILSVYVDGFLNIVDTRIALSPVTALLSTNNYGKSNLMEAIHFGSTMPSLSRSAQERFVAQAPYMSVDRKNAYQNFTFEIIFKTKFQNEAVEVRYGYVISWKKHVEKEWLELRKESTGKESNFFSRENGQRVIKYKTSETNSAQELSVNSYELAITSLSYRLDYKYIELVQQVCNINVLIERSLDTSSKYAQSLFEVNGFDLLDYDDNDINRLLFHLNREHPDTFKRIVNSYTDIFPQYEEIQVEEFPRVKEDAIVLEEVVDVLNKAYPNSLNLASDEYRITFKDRNLMRPATTNELSNGTKRVLCILLVSALAGLHSFPIIGLEEIETSIHPSLIGQLFDVVVQFVSESKFLVSTHSPSVAQFLNPNCIYIGQPRDDGLARFVLLSKNGVKKIASEAKQFGVSVGEMVFRLLSEDYESMQRLQSYLEV